MEIRPNPPPLRSKRVFSIQVKLRIHRHPVGEPVQSISQPLHPESEFSTFDYYFWTLNKSFIPRGRYRVNDTHGFYVVTCCLCFRNESISNIKWLPSVLFFILNTIQFITNYSVYLFLSSFLIPHVTLPITLKFISLTPSVIVPLQMFFSTSCTSLLDTRFTISLSCSGQTE